MVVAVHSPGSTPDWASRRVRAVPRQRRAEETRARLLDAARATIRDLGLQGLTLREVARRADRSPAVVYRYVRDREALLALLVEELNVDVGTALMHAAQSAPPDVEGTARVMVHAALDVFVRDPALAGALLRLPPTLGAWKAPALPTHIAELAHAVFVARRPEAIARDPHLASRLAAVVQALIVARDRRGTPTLAALEPALVRVVVRASGGRASPVVARAGGILTDDERFAVREQRPRRRDAQPGYQAVCEAAAACVAEQGLQVSTNFIAERAGVSVGSMFRYFPTKTALVASLAANVNERFGALAATGVLGASSVGDALDATLAAAVRTWETHGPLIAALVPALVCPPFVEPPPLPAELIAATREIMRGGTAFEDPELAAFVTLVAGQAMFVDALVRGEDLRAASGPIRAFLGAVLFDAPSGEPAPPIGSPQTRSQDIQG